MAGGKVQVEVVGGDLTLSDDGQLMQRVRVVARQEGDASSAKMSQSMQRSMKHGPKGKWGL